MGEFKPCGVFGDSEHFNGKDYLEVRQTFQRPPFRMVVGFIGCKMRTNVFYYVIQYLLDHQNNMIIALTNEKKKFLKCNGKNKGGKLTFKL